MHCVLTVFLNTFSKLSLHVAVCCDLLWMDEMMMKLMLMLLSILMMLLPMLMMILNFDDDAVNVVDAVDFVN